MSKLSLKNSLLLTTAVLVVSGFFVAASAQAAGPWFVDPAGSDANDCLSTTTACLTIQGAITKASSGDTIIVGAGTYIEVGQIVINKNLSIVGAAKTTTIIKPAQNTTNSGDGRGWFMVKPGVEFNLSNVTLDGSGKLVVQAIRLFGSGTIDNNIIKNIYYEKGTGIGVVVAGNNIIISHNTLSNIERVGIIASGSGVTNAVIDGNTYTGKGVGVWLNYGIEVGAGAVATLTGNTIINCLGVADDSAHSTSAAIAVSVGSTATITGNNILTGNYTGILVGHGASDTSTVTATSNTFTNNGSQISIYGSTVNFDLEAALVGNTFDKAVVVRTGTNISVREIFGSIQAAIDAAVDSDTINVAAGTYNESQIVIDKALTIQGAGINSSIIDGENATNLTGEGLVRITASGNVKFDGFTLQNVGVDPTKTNASVPIRVGIYVSSPSGTYTISNNKIIGTNDPDDAEDYGFYASGGSENIVFSSNTIMGTGANAILVENHEGPTDINGNILDEGVYGSTAVFVMTSGIDVTTLQNITSNIINVGTGNFTDDSWTSGGITFSSAYDGTTGTFTNIEITDNTITNLLAHRRGISLVNNSSNGTAGEISNFTITDNTITGTGAPDSIGIKLSGLVSGETIRNNKLSNLEKGLISTLASINATNNWWGSAVLATVASKISENVTFKPYYITSTVGDLGILSDIKSITAFTIPNQTGSTIIDQDAHTIAITMPYGTNATALVPTFTTTGSGVKIGDNTQTNATTANNFTTPQTYIVTSVDEATTQDYVVTVTVLKDTQTAPVTGNYYGSGSATVNSNTPVGGGVGSSSLVVNNQTGGNTGGNLINNTANLTGGGTQTTGGGAGIPSETGEQGAVTEGTTTTEQAEVLATNLTPTTTLQASLLATVLSTTKGKVSLGIELLLLVILIGSLILYRRNRRRANN